MGVEVDVHSSSKLYFHAHVGCTVKPRLTPED